jgi:hypothetical protein
LIADHINNREDTELYKSRSYTYIEHLTEMQVKLTKEMRQLCSLFFDKEYEFDHCSAYIFDILVFINSLYPEIFEKYLIKQGRFSRYELVNIRKENSDTSFFLDAMDKYYGMLLDPIWFMQQAIRRGESSLNCIDVIIQNIYERNKDRFKTFIESDGYKG